MAKALKYPSEDRTVDVSIEDDITFSDLQLSEEVLKGLKAAGFEKPSPIQRQAIPYGRCGYDLIIQAKSGTGKTCVYAVIALEMLEPDLKKIQVIVLAPTREISVQVKDVMSLLSKFLDGVKTESFIGGLPFHKDKKKIDRCQIAVGAPGRMRHLISEDLMEVDAVRLLILDEADRLMEENFRYDISYIFSKLPSSKQLIAVSATFPEELERFVAEFMNKPMRISPTMDPVLVGVRQFVYLIPESQSVLDRMNNKFDALMKILSELPFKQCFVFTNLQSWAESICDRIKEKGFSTAFINGGLNQGQRLGALGKFRQSRVRILFSTDLTSRGIDCENVDLVVNFDLPHDCATYLHRIGRAGRYGSYGKAVTIVQEGPEADSFTDLLSEISESHFSVYIFPTEEVFLNSWEGRIDKIKKFSCLFGEGRSESKRMLEELTQNKEDEVEMTPEEAADILSQCRLQPPTNFVSSTWESLNNDLANFQIDDSETPPTEIQSSGIAPIPEHILKSMLVLESKGWDELCDEFQPSNAEDAAGGPGTSMEVSSVSNPTGLRSSLGEEEENAAGRDGSDGVGAAAATANADADAAVEDDAGGAESSDGSTASSDTASSNVMNKYVINGGERTAVQRVNSDYNQVLQNWITMWMSQCRAVSSYVHCYNFWMDMN